MVIISASILIPILILVWTLVDLVTIDKPNILPESLSFSLEGENMIGVQVSGFSESNFHFHSLDLNGFNCKLMSNDGDKVKNIGKF